MLIRPSFITGRFQLGKKPFLLELDLLMENIKRTTTLWAVKVIISVNPIVLRISCYLHLIIRGNWSLSSLTANHYHWSDSVIRALHTISFNSQNNCMTIVIISILHIRKWRQRVDTINKLESMSARIWVQAACSRIPLYNHHTITHCEVGRRQRELGKWIYSGCEVCAMKWGCFSFSFIAFPVVFPLHSSVNWSLFY